MNINRFPRIIALALMAGIVFTSGCNVLIPPSADDGDRVLYGITEVDDTTAGLVISKQNIITTETGGTDTFTVVLRTPPTADVVIPVISSSDTTEGSIALTTLTFTPANWSTPQTITAVGVDDNFVDGNINYTVSSTGSTSDDPMYQDMTFNVPGINIDDETAQVVVTNTCLNMLEGGGTSTFQVVLSQQPTGDVTVPIASQLSSRLTVDKPTLTFTQTNYNVAQTVTISAPNNALPDGHVTTNITLGTATNYADIDPDDIKINLTDDDSKGVIVSNLSRETTEAGQNAFFTVRLTQPPSADVTIPINETADSVNAGNSEGTISASSLTFTFSGAGGCAGGGNWCTPQSVTVTPVDENIHDGNKQYIIAVNNSTGGDTEYNAIDPDDVTVNNIDNDVSGFIIVANTPTTSTTTTAANSANVTGFATDDSNILDNTVHSSWTIRLRSQPTSNVVLNLTNNSPNNDGILSVSTHTFTTANWNVPQPVTVSGGSDGTNEGNQNYTITSAIVTTDATYSSTTFVGAPRWTIFSCDNDGTNTIASCRRSGGFGTSEGGGSATLWVVARADPGGCTISVPVSSSDTGEGTVTSPITIDTTNWNTMLGTGTNRTVITGVDDGDIDQGVQYTIQLATSTGGCLTPEVDLPDVPIVNVDNEQVLQVGSSTGDTTENGQQQSFGLRMQIQPTADVTFTVSCAAATECASLSVSEVTFTPTNWNVFQTITVTPIDDQRVDGTRAQTVSFGAMVSDDFRFTDYVAPNLSPMNNLDNDRLIWMTDKTYRGNFNATSSMNSIDASCGASALDTNAPSNVSSVTYRALIGHPLFRVATTNGTNATGQNGWVLLPNTEYYLKTGGGSIHTTLLFKTDANGLFSFGTLSNAFSGSGADTFWTGFNSNWTIDSTGHCGNWSDRDSFGQYGVGGSTGTTSITTGVGATSSCHESTGDLRKLLCVQQ